VRFFICKDPSKFIKHSYKQYGEWCYYHDDKVSVWECDEYMVLYSGYLIEGDIEDACERWSFDDENGNFFAIKLTKRHYDISIDYFQQHKIFVAHKYGIEISNHIPFMTCNKSDVVSKYLEDVQCLEYSREENNTFYKHIQGWMPRYDYLGDTKRALEEEKWKDLEPLADYIHECMEQHSNLIKSRFKNRFISLSEGIDSALQTQYFLDDPKYMYHVTPAEAGDDAMKYKQLTAKKFSDVSLEVLDLSKGVDLLAEHLVDSSNRGVDFLPTFMQLAKLDTKPDIVVYGSNGDEMCLHKLVPYLHYVMQNNRSKQPSLLKLHIKSEIEKRKHFYGASYTVGKHKNAMTYLDEWLYEWFRYDKRPEWDRAKYDMLKGWSPKLYNRNITVNSDVLCTSLYCDRRIFHEIKKTPKKFLLGDALDTPIQKMLLKRHNYEFITPHKDAVQADYQEMRESVFDATFSHDIGQNI